MLQGTTLSQLIAFIGSLVLAKLYGAVAYAWFGAFMAFVGIASVINTLQLEYALVTDKSDNNTKHLLSFLILITTPIALTIACFYIGFQYFFGSLEFDFIIILMSIIASIIVAQNVTFDSLLTRLKQFKISARIKIILTLSTVILQSIFYFFSKEKGLIFGAGVAFFLVLLIYYYYNKYHIVQPNWKIVKSTINEHKNLLKYAFPSHLTNALGAHLITIMFVVYFEEAQAGTYALSNKILMAPLFLISGAVSKVYFQKANEIYLSSKEKLYSFTIKIVRNNILIMIAIVLLINTVGLYILSFFFDKEWELLSPFIWIMSFLVIARSSFNPISSISIVLNKNEVSFIFNICFLLINILAFSIGLYYKNIVYSVIILSFLGGIAYVVLLIYFLFLLKKIEKEHQV